MQHQRVDVLPLIIFKILESVYNDFVKDVFYAVWVVRLTVAASMPCLCALQIAFTAAPHLNIVRVICQP